ncbi:MAG: flavodoxin family protein [bacterium]|nr:flavodoxin family protein [bacterium]
MITAIGIAGSPRRNGNSTTLLKSVLEGAEAKGARTDIIYLNDLVYKGCQACKKCSPGGTCIIKDALTPVISTLKLADIWVLASPIYYDAFSGQIKLFFDRLRHLTQKDGIRKPQLKGKRRASLIVTYEDNPSEYYLKVAEAQAGYLPWMGDFGEIRILSQSNLLETGAASKRPDLLEKAKETGRQLAEELF